MKSRSKKSGKYIAKFNKQEINEALQWIDNLSPKQKAKFEMLVRVQTAQLLMEEYLSIKNRNAKKSRRHLKR